jgi:FecR protein
MSNWKVWPHLAIVAVLCAVVAGVGVAMWMKHEQTASAESLPNAARIQHVEGDVALSNSPGTADNTGDPQWVAATENQPFSVGDRVYTRDNSRASVAFTGRNQARLNPNTSLDVLALNSDQTQLALRDGSAMFDVGYLAPGELFEVATPYGAVDFNQPGLYNVGINDGSVIVSVLNGLAQVVGLGNSGQISKGEMLTLLGQTAADVVLSRVNSRDAGYIIDDYYSYQYPQYYDGRYRDYNTYLSDPYYFDPYRRSVSYQHVNSYIPGLSDLDYYGDWQNLDNYGYAWSPRVDNSWSPYQQGYWSNDYPYGPTWVSSEPWGYAPYHYGRWAHVSDRWYWIPDTVNTSPRYSPALVAFVPFGQDQVGWVPLGPGDAYAPRYYNSNWQPYYLTRTQNVQTHIANLYVPGAVTVLPVDDFARGFDWKRARKADRQMLVSVNPVLDPLTLTPLRNAVVHSAWGRGKKDLPPGIAKKLRDTTVVTSAFPIAPPFRRDLNRELRVETVSEKFKDRKINVTDRRGDKHDLLESDNRFHRLQGDDRYRGNVQRRAPGRSDEVRQTNAPQVQVERPVVTRQDQPRGERVGNREKPKGQGASNSDKHQWRGEVFKAAPPRAERGNGKKQNVVVPRSSQPLPVRQPNAPQSDGRRGKPAKVESGSAPQKNKHQGQEGGKGKGRKG